MHNTIFSSQRNKKNIIRTICSQKELALLDPAGGSCGICDRGGMFSDGSEGGNDSYFNKRSGEQ